MELVRGIRITDYCDQARLNTQERLGLFIKVCQAIQHAHQKGIIHRDIKPSNILVTLHDGVPVPKVIDFGIAKATEGRLTDHTVYTQLHQFIGTPAYMSPEQAEMSGLDIDTRSDIYSLGVVLYELLAGSTPFDPKELLAAGIDAMRKTLRETEPVRPSTRLTRELTHGVRGGAPPSGGDVGSPGTRRADVGLGPPEGGTPRGNQDETSGREMARVQRLKALIATLRGDLDWIVMKCLEKDRTRRYETANGLAADLNRYLANEPVLARPPSTIYRFQKAWRRNRTLFFAVGAVAVALILGTVVSSWLAFRATRAERVATAEVQRKTQIAEFLRSMLESAGPEVAQGRDTTVLRDVLNQAAHRVLHDLRSQPDVAMTLVRTIGRTYGSLGEFELAERFQREALSILQQTDRLGSLEGAAALNELGRTLQRRGNEAAATNVLARSIQIAARNHNDPAVAEAMIDLAYVYEELGQTGRAENLMTNAISKLAHSLGPSAAETLSAQTLLAGTYVRQGRYPEADATASRVLLLQRSGSGIDTPESLKTLFILAVVRQIEGKYGEAEALARDCWERRTKVLGPDHPATLASMDDLGLIYSYEGQYAKAEAICRQALTAHVRRLGPNHRDSLAMKSNLAEHLRNQNRFAESEVLFKEVIAAYIAQYPKDQPFRLEAQNSLSTLYLFAGRCSEAEALARTVLAARRPHPEEVTPLADALSQLAATLLCNKKWNEAVIVSRECLTLRQKAQAARWPVYAAEGQLGLSLLGLSRFAEAEPLLADAHRGLTSDETAIPAVEKVRIAEVLRGWVQLYRATGRNAEAARWQPELDRRLARARIHDETVEPNTVRR
jgi:tetratricopeptide (TPR) repeat protein